MAKPKVKLDTKNPDWQTYRKEALAYRELHGTLKGFPYFEYANDKWYLDPKGKGNFSPKSLTAKLLEVADKRAKSLNKSFTLEDYLAEKVFVEQDWAFDESWESAPWTGENTWGRYKIDAFFKDGDYGKVIDFKTGKYWSNEVGYRDQCSLYACGVFSRFPDLENVETELWYLDHQKISRHAFSKEEIQEVQDNFTSRASAMTNHTKFIATPSENSCRWCPFKQVCPDYER